MKYLVIMLLISLGIPAAAQKQGICGKVLWVEGNQMPGPGRKPSAGTGVVREILVYEPVTRENTTQQNGFYANINAKLVATGKSKADGSYKIKLPPGKYSVFVKEPGGLFANLFDHNGAINTVSVEKGRFTNFHIKVNYKAAY